MPPSATWSPSAIRATASSREPSLGPADFGLASSRCRARRKSSSASRGLTAAAASPDELPAGLVAVELGDRACIERVAALGDVDVLGLPAERGGEVPLAGVVDDGDDRGQLGVPAGELQGGGHVAAARDP